MTNDLATLLSVVGLVGGGTGIAAIIVAVTSRKKTKADALQVIEAAASAQVTRMREEAESWRGECINLRGEMDTLKGKVEETESCQTILKRQISTLEYEKRTLIEKVEELKKRIDGLEAENLRLKLQRESE